MKIYEYDRGVYGMTVIVANSREHALELFNNAECRDDGLVTIGSFIEHEIKVGLIIDNLGDA